MGPGGYLTHNNRFAQLLARQQSPNNGTTYGGLANVAQQALLGYALGSDRDDQQAANQALMQGLNPQMPEGVEGPPQAGGSGLALQNLQNLQDNPYASRMAQSLLLQQLDQQAQARADQQAFERKKELRQSPKWTPPATPVPGRDVPFSKDVFTQRQALANKGTTVNVGPQGIDYGKPPKDMTWARGVDGKIVLQPDPQTGFNRPVAVPIAGGPVETERKGAEEAAKTKQAEQAKYADVVTEDIGRAMKIIQEANIPVTGLGAAASVIPGTPAHDVARLIDTVKANAGFDRLQQMRDASPTGGALGQVSELENRLLQATIGNLEQSQSKEQLLYNLQRVQDLYLDIVHGPGNRPAASPQGGVEDLIELYGGAR